MENSADKLAQGLERLRQAGDDRERLGSALLSIHGALEDHFRAWLAGNRKFPADQRALLANRQQVNWDKLLEWMQNYGNLSAEMSRRIRQANRLRQEVAHGGSYSGTRSFLDGYAALVQTLCEDTYPITQNAAPPTPATTPARTNGRAPTRQQPKRPASKQARTAPRPAARPPTVRTPKRPSDAPPPWPIGVVGRFLVFVIVLLILFIVLRMFGS